MHFHIGNRTIVSKEEIIGIFARESVIESDLNNKYAEKFVSDTKSIVIDVHDNVLSSIVSTNTLIERFNNVQFDECLYKRSSK